MNNSLPSAPEEFLQMALSSRTPNEVDAVLRIAQEKGIPLNTQLTRNRHARTRALEAIGQIVAAES